MVRVDHAHGRHGAAVGESERGVVRPAGADRDGKGDVAVREEVLDARHRDLVAWVIGALHVTLLALFT